MKRNKGILKSAFFIGVLLIFGLKGYAEITCRVISDRAEFLDENTFEFVRTLEKGAIYPIQGEQPLIVANANGDGFVLINAGTPYWVKLSEVEFSSDTALPMGKTEDAQMTETRPLTAENAVSRIWQKLKFAFGGSEYNTLMVISAILTCLLGIGGIYGLVVTGKNKDDWFPGLFHRRCTDRTFVFQWDIYGFILSVSLTLLLAFVGSILVLFLFGGVTLLLFWVIKILLYIVLVVGGIALVVGILGLIAKEGWGCLPLVAGGIICSWSGAIEAGGNWLVDAGLNFMNRLNLFGWGIGIFRDYWDCILFVVVIPLVFLVAVAGVIMLICAGIIGIEMLVSRLYSVHFYCPKCGTPVGSAAYLANDGRELFQAGYRLLPGTRGIFHQHSAANGRKYPTMVMNGRLKMKRKCTNPNCRGVFVPVGGTDLHIGIVGNRSVGKTYLLYSGLKMLRERYKGNFKEEDIHTDNVKIDDAYGRISRGGDMQTVNRDNYRALQVVYHKLFRMLPYHLYFYDVAGEKFDARSESYKRGLTFYRNVQSIIFLIDPCMVDFTGMSPDVRLKKWIEQKAGRGEKYNADHVLTTMISMLEMVDEQMNLKSKIDFHFVLVKKDTGYFETFGMNSEEVTAAEIENFMRERMDMNSIIDNARAEFRSVGFYTVSATDTRSKSLFRLFAGILKQRGINIR